MHKSKFVFHCSSELESTVPHNSAVRPAIPAESRGFAKVPVKGTI